MTESNLGYLMRKENIADINLRTVMLIYACFFFQGNQENRVVIYDYKTIDYINFILRAGDIAECPPEKVGIEIYSVNNGWSIYMYTKYSYFDTNKKANWKLQGVPQSQSAASPRYQEQEKDKN